MHVWACSAAQSCPTPCDPMQFPRLLHPWDFSRQEYWSGLPIPPSGDLPYPGVEPESVVSLALTGRFFITEPPGKFLNNDIHTDKYFPQMHELEHSCNSAQEFQTQPLNVLFLSPSFGCGHFHKLTYKLLYHTKKSLPRN